MIFDSNVLRQKLSALRARDLDLAVFGASSHRYELHPPLSEREVRVFEERHCVVLPDDYRAFIMTLGNGGAGPSYGVFRLGEMDGGEGYDKWSVGDLAARFPHETAWNLPRVAFEPPSFASDAQRQAWLIALEEQYLDTAHVAGAFPICHHGCGPRSWLVVSGAERGHVWHDERDYDAGIRPHEIDGRRATFVEWYEEWLDTSLRRLARS